MCVLVCVCVLACVSTSVHIWQPISYCSTLPAVTQGWVKADNSMGIPTVPKTLKYKWLYTGHVLRMKIQWGFPIPTSKLIALLCLLLQVADRLNSHLVLAAKRYTSLGMSEVRILLKLKLKQQCVLK